MHAILDERDKALFNSKIDMIEDNVFVVSKSGSGMIVSDCTNDPPKGLRVFGKTEQKTYSGNQLLKLPDVDEYTSHGITFSCKGGVVNMKGTSTSVVNTGPTISMDIEGSVGTYTISGSQYLYVSIRYSNDEMRYINNERSFTLDGTEKKVRVYFSIQSEGMVLDEIIYPMLNAGTTVLPWEPYTGGMASPNPEYPQELVDNQIEEIGVYGGNLLDKNDESICSHVYINMTGTLLGFAPISNNYSVVLKIKPNTSYTIYCKDSARLRACTTTELLPEIENETASVNVNGIQKDGNTSLTITSGLNDKYLYINLSETEELFVQALQTLIVSVGTQVIPYEPYKPKQSLMTSTPNGLPGIKVTDASLATYTDENGQMWCCDEKDFERGVYIQRVNKELLVASIVALVGNITNRFMHRTTYRMLAGTVMSNGLLYNLWGTVKGSIGNGTSNGENLYFTLTDENVTTVSACNDFLNANPMYVMYILETPIETPLSEEELAQYKALTMNYPNTTILNNSNAHMEVDYVADIKNHIEQNYVTREEAETLLSRVSTIEEVMV